jgi:hypothetical protein
MGIVRVLVVANIQAKVSVTELQLLVPQFPVMLPRRQVLEPFSTKSLLFVMAETDEIGSRGEL